MKKLLAIVLVLALLLTGCAAEQSMNIVDTFDYAAIKNQTEKVIHRANNQESGTQQSQKLSQIDEETRTPVKPSGEWQWHGVILIVEVQKSQNHLVGDHVYAEEKGSSEKYLFLKEQRQYDEVPNISHLHLNSYVQTTVKIKEILYQETGLDLTENDKVTLFEQYFVLDDRVKHIRNKTNSNKQYEVYCRTGKEWHPLQKNEIYIVFGSYCSSYPAGQAFWYENQIVINEIYGLSQPETQAGYNKDGQTFADGIAYLKQNYDLSKYGLK